MEFITISQSVAKAMFLLLLGVYIVFAAIMVRQEQLMSKVVVIEAVAPLLRTLIWVHLIAAVTLFLVSIILL